MKLNDTQRALVSENLKLVHKVIHDRVHNPQQLGIFVYDDLVQIGCIGLCKAAATDKGGTFSTYAYRLIWNEICSALEYASVRSARETVTDPELMARPGAASEIPDIGYLDLESLLTEAEIRASGVTAKGIQAIRLKAKGYTSREIGMILDAPVNHITAWIAKARAYLKADPRLQELHRAG